MPLHLAKRQFSCLVKEAARGDEVTITERGRPVAKLFPLSFPEKRVLSRMAGQIRIPYDFDNPLPDDVLRAFLGE